MEFPLCLKVLRWILLFFCSTYAFEITNILMNDEPTVDISRIVGGKEVMIDEYPHQCSMIINNNSFCGCFLLSNIWIGTAAHCVQGVEPSTVVVRAGSHWRKNGTILSVENITCHKDYDTPQFDNDIALLKMNKPINFSNQSNMKPINLPPKGFTLKEGSKVSVSGWGRMVQGAPTIPEHLRAVEIDVVPQRQCRLYYYGILTDNMWCGGTLLFSKNLGGKGTCQGDSGGAATQDGMVVGIVSWGRGCALPISPSVFADITAQSIRNFIYDHTGM